MRRSLSPGAALSFFRTMKEADVSDILSSVGVPTLILCKPKQRAEADYVAERIHGSEIAEMPRLTGLFTWVDDEVHEQTMRETERFLTHLGRPREPDRILATVLFTDIVGSTKRASELGNAAWRALLERHHTVVRSRLGQFNGEEIDTAGTVSSPLSMVLVARSSARALWSRTCARSGLRSVLVFTPGSASEWKRS